MPSVQRTRRARVKGGRPDARAPLTSNAEPRQRLIEAGTEIFGIYNLEGATTRQLAKRAGVNQAAIPYYFGGKEGLYQAVIEYLFTTNVAELRPFVIEVRRRLEEESISRSEALELLKKLLRALLGIILRKGASTTWARIIMREQMQPTPAFDFIYERMVRLVHETVSALLAKVIGKKATDPNVVLRAHMLVGHILIFLSGRETIRRRLHLDGYNEKEIRQIQQALEDQLDLLESERKGSR
jgi:AcrR family transcriptional regulator